MNIIHYTYCPLCNSDKIQEVFRVKDHTVSGHLFPVWECSNCTLRFTQDVPDENSIGAYYKSDEYISHTDEAPGLINSIYRTVRKITLRAKTNLVEKYSGVKKGSLLDLGAGTGAFVNEMNRKGWKVTGLEPDPDARGVASKRYGLELDTPDKLFGLPANSFDAITLWHVLEHVHDLHGYLKQLRQLLKENGILLIAVPNYTSKDAGIYKNDWAAYDPPRHLYHFSPTAMQRLLNDHGLTIRKKLPMWFDSYYISMLSNRYRSGRTGILSALFRGSRSNMAAMGNTDRCSSIIYVVKRR